MERRVQRENHQTYLLPPSQVIPRGGGGLDLASAN